MITANDTHILESLPFGVVVVDLHGHVQSMNRYAKSLLHFTGKPNGHEHIHTLLGDQETIPIEKYVHSGRIGEMGSTIESHDRMLEVSGAPLKGRKDATAGAIIILKDITEIEKIKAVEKKNEKHAIIGELSSDFAHEIRNPLGSIKLLASLIKKESRRKKDINRADLIIASVKTMEEKISGMIQLGEARKIPMASVNIHDVLKDILMFSENIIDGESVFLSAQYADIEPVVECNAYMMKQLFLHLILNALPEAGRLDIMTRYLEKQRLIEVCFIEKSEAALESIRSNILHRLTRAKEKNWGLGLAIVHNIVNMYRGSIRVETMEEAGTAFILSFPLVEMNVMENGKPSL
jgi:nitrogen-specific signal transduction histidine kinase